jgi:hypothetical protein
MKKKSNRPRGYEASEKARNDLRVKRAIAASKRPSRAEKIRKLDELMAAIKALKKTLK